jgi:hypothetical protein
MPGPGPRQRLRAVVREVDGLGHPLAEGVDHGHLEVRAHPGALPVVQGGQDAAIGVHAGRDVGDGDPRPGRALRCAGRHHQAGLALHEQVIGLLLAVRAVGAVAGDRAADQPGPVRAQRRRAEPEAVGGARGQVLDEHVGGVDEPAEEVAVTGFLDVELDALLAPVEPDEVAGLAERGPVVAAGKVTAAGPFDLDDPRAEVGELTGGERGGHGLLEGDDSETVERVSHDVSIMPQEVFVRAVEVGPEVKPGLSGLARGDGRTGRAVGRIRP